jgi:hypothetical protein
MIELAGDAARHDRMLDVTGGDAAALAEARAVLDRIAGAEDPDLASALALACHRDHLVDRNARIPDELPAAWAALGQQPRAEALARSITDPAGQARALAGIAGELARAGQPQEAAAIAADAVAAARSVANTAPPALPVVAGILDQAGLLQGQAGDVLKAAERERSLAGLRREMSAQPPEAAVIAAGAVAAARSATNSANTVTDPVDLYGFLTHITTKLIRAGQHQQAEVVARSITNPVEQAGALAELCCTGIGCSGL